MGLIKQNYTVKETGITLPTAYAIVKTMQISGNRARAAVAIQQSRDNAFKLKPLQIVTIDFTFNRAENPIAKAYEALKQPMKKRTVQDGKLAMVEIPSPFQDWENDL